MKGCFALLCVSVLMTIRIYAQTGAFPGGGGFPGAGFPGFPGAGIPPGVNVQVIPVPFPFPTDGGDGGGGGGDYDDGPGPVRVIFAGGGGGAGRAPTVVNSGGGGLSGIGSALSGIIPLIALAAIIRGLNLTGTNTG